MHPQEQGAMPLHIRHPVHPVSGGGDLNRVKRGKKGKREVIGRKDEDLFSVFSVCRSHKEYTDLPFHQVCEENFEKDCQLTFKQQAYNETVSLITAKKTC